MVGGALHWKSVERDSIARLLVIDDELRLRDQLHTVLERKGQEVVLAESEARATIAFARDGWRRNPHIDSVEIEMR